MSEHLIIFDWRKSRPFLIIAIQMKKNVDNIFNSNKPVTSFVLILSFVDKKDLHIHSPIFLESTILP